MSTSSDDRVTSQLEQAYSGVEQIYTIMVQATALVIGGEAVLLGYGVQNKNAGAIFLGGVLCFALYWLYYRAGQTLGALMAVALAIESSDGGIPSSRSFIAALVVSFRGRKVLAKLEELRALQGKEAIDWLSRSSDYAIFGSYLHPFRSKTTLLTLLVGIMLVAGSIVLALSNTWTFV